MDPAHADILPCSRNSTVSNVEAGSGIWIFIILRSCCSTYLLPISEKGCLQWALFILMGFIVGYYESRFLLEKDDSFSALRLFDL